jgi:hypothetical protein
MRSFFHNFFYHPTSSAWGIGAIVMGTIAAYRDDWSFALSFWTLGLQQMGSRDTDRTAERLPPPREDSGPSPLPIILFLVTGTLALSGCAGSRYVERVEHVKDTVFVSSPARVDTFTATLRSVDTVRIDTGRIRLFVERRTDTLRIAADCLPDSTPVRIVTKVENRGQVLWRDRDVTSWRKLLAWFVVGVAVGVLLCAGIMWHRK